MPEKTHLRALIFLGHWWRIHRQGKRAFELHRRPVTQRRVQSLLVIDLFDEPPIEARASARSRYSCRYTSSYFRVFIHDSQAAFSQGLALWLMLISTAVGLQQVRVIVAMHTGCRGRNDAPTRRPDAATPAPCGAPPGSDRLPRVRSSAQPITRREKASMTTARYTNSVSSRM